MYLTDINKIAMILKENKDKKQLALTGFRNQMRRKYCTTLDDHWLSKMNDEEKRTLEVAEAERDDAMEVYEAFVNNDWR